MNIKTFIMCIHGERGELPEVKVRHGSGNERIQTHLSLCLLDTLILNNLYLYFEKDVCIFLLK